MTNTPTNTTTQTYTPTNTETAVPTGTPTYTPTVTRTHTPVVTATPSATAILVGHVAWHGRPAQPNALQQMPVTLTLKLGTTEVDYTAQTTDSYGFFTVSLGSLVNGNYTWRVKGPKYLANLGEVTLAGAPLINVEMGTLRSGDCNNDNIVSILDLNIVKNSYGKRLGDVNYDPRADLNGDNVITTLDFTLLRTSFGLGGADPAGPSR